MTDTPPADDVDPRSHKWWLTARTGEHGRDCQGCRRTPGGPEHKETRP